MIPRSAPSALFSIFLVIFLLPSCASESKRRYRAFQEYFDGLSPCDQVRTYDSLVVSHLGDVPIWGDSSNFYFSISPELFHAENTIVEWWGCTVGGWYNPHSPYLDYIEHRREIQRLLEACDRADSGCSCETRPLPVERRIPDAIPYFVDSVAKADTLYAVGTRYVIASLANDTVLIEWCRDGRPQRICIPTSTRYGYGYRYAWLPGDSILEFRVKSIGRTVESESTYLMRFWPEGPYILLGFTSFKMFLLDNFEDHSVTAAARFDFDSMLIVDSASPTEYRRIPVRLDSLTGSYIGAGLDHDSVLIERRRGHGEWCDPRVDWHNPSFWFYDIGSDDWKSRCQRCVDSGCGCV